jgi:NADPH-dependent glutamate synthase beta subunit-like oxidoreductase/NAD(P)H-flavin reductase
MGNSRVPTIPELHIKGFKFQELLKAEGLERLDKVFLERLKNEAASLHGELIAYRLKLKPFNSQQISTLLIETARYLESFIAELFQIEAAVKEAQLAITANSPIFLFKQRFVLREAKRKLSKVTELDDFQTLTTWLLATLTDHNLNNSIDLELAVARLGEIFLRDEVHYAEKIEKLTAWCVRAITDPEGCLFTKGWVSFRLPNRIDYLHLIPLHLNTGDELIKLEGKPTNLRHRDGFKLTDSRMSQRETLGEIHYCVYCHKNDGDFCSTGFPVKKGEPALGFKVNPLNEVLTGCPLEEKISEMHVLKRDGYNIGALAVVMIDNPMCPITGHRICNDCMKACIYQKQEPVNIPQIETRVLTDVLSLPWGVEIYDLLTRWNPLREHQWSLKPYNGLKVLIMGMGPAGLTLAHHLTMEGFAVVGADGLKIEPLPSHYIQKPIHSYAHLKEELDDRLLAGFGGVAEYGITVRWDKNFLKLLYISLSRRPTFQIFGGVRFGGTLTVEDAWSLGFDHMALAVGAGLPKELNISGSLAPGMRQANDFLMALQLTGAAKKSSLANLQIRLPALVIGGGLTGIDTATEIQAYYVSQLEKTLERYETLVNYFGKEAVHLKFSDYSSEILQEFISHALEIRAEREHAKAQCRKPDFIRLLRKWGGVTIVYRRKLQDSPAYSRNHEEVTKALEEGIFYAERLEPIAVRLDDYGHVASLVCKEWPLQGEAVEKVIPARSIFVATGARPNIAYEFEHRGTFHREGSEYQTYTENQGKLEVILPDGHCKVEEFGAFTSYELDGYRVTFLGDTHPIFHGSVVKAIASAKRIYPKILNLLKGRVSAVGSLKEYDKFAQTMRHLFEAKIISIKRLSSHVISLVIQAPMATKNFKPGQFYRVQNFESLAPFIGSTRLHAEGVALIGTDVDKEQGTISLIVIEQGVSTRLFSTFKAGDSISLMGPTGVRSKIPRGEETILIIGGQMAGAHLRAIGPLLRASGNRVIFIGAYKKFEDIHFKQELENAADCILWIAQEGHQTPLLRAEDSMIKGDLIASIMAFAKQHTQLLKSVDRVHLIGTYRFIKLMQSARESLFNPYFKEKVHVVASVYGPMQCMLKGVCAQCLQWQIDPVTKLRTKAVFACSWQEQPLDIVDLDNLTERLSQNHMQETLTNLWLDYLFAVNEVPRI